MTDRLKLGRWAWWQLAWWRWQHGACLVTHQRVGGPGTSLASLTGWWCVDHQMGIGRLGRP